MWLSGRDTIGKRACALACWNLVQNYGVLWRYKKYIYTFPRKEFFSQLFSQLLQGLRCVFCVLVTCTNQDMLNHCIDEYSSMLYIGGEGKEGNKKQGKIDWLIYPTFCLWHLKICRLCICILWKMNKEWTTLCLLDFSVLLIFHSFEWLFTDNTFMFERRTTLKTTLTAS